MTTRVCLFVTVLALLVVSLAAAQFPILDMIQLLRGDPQMRAAFINKVVAPVANKMFECGMIP